MTVFKMRKKFKISLNLHSFFKKSDSIKYYKFCKKSYSFYIVILIYLIFNQHFYNFIIVGSQDLKKKKKEMNITYLNLNAKKIKYSSLFN